MFSIVILFLALILWKIKKVNNEGGTSETLSVDSTLPLRGICAIEIMIGHLGLELRNVLILFPFRKAGILIVGIFLFLSGYGLLYSFQKKQNYLENFLIKRVVKLMLPVCFVQGIYLLFLVLENKLDTNYILLIKSVNWYVWEILAFYVLFYVVFKYVEVNNAIILMTSLSLVFIVICYVFHVSNPWYGSTLCFSLGLIVARQKERVLIWCNKDIFKKVCYFSIILVGCFFLFFKLSENNIIGVLIARNIASLSFVLVVILILQRYKFGNSLSMFLGKISYEIYLIHIPMISFLHSESLYIKNEVLYAWMVVILSIGGAWGINKLVGKIEKGIYKRK